MGTATSVQGTVDSFAHLQLNGRTKNVLPRRRSTLGGETRGYCYSPRYTVGREIGFAVAKDRCEREPKCIGIYSRGCSKRVGSWIYCEGKESTKVLNTNSHSCGFWKSG